MSDKLPPEPAPPAEAGTPTAVTNISGGVNLDAQRDVNIGGDVVRRDKTTTNIDTGGGASIAGNVTLSEGSEFVGRDKIIYEAPEPIVTSLHQLPSPPRDFTGRDTELADLMTRADTERMTFCALSGMGGVGKTALALVFAAWLKPRYPDAQLYLDLKGADKLPLSVTEALRYVIRSYHPTAKLPESEAELRAMYMSVLEGQRALILMDNAASDAQIEPLIPPPRSGCFLLVTSRQQFTLPGLFAKDLSILPPNDARDLVLKIAPRVDGQAEAMARLCGYLPLALRLAGSALAQRRTLTPGDYVKRLADAQTRLELVEASLSLSYNLLSEDLQQAWCALAVFPDTFDLSAATAVWAVEKNLAEDRLDELVHYSLVDWNETDARARLHDLARLFANKRLGDAARLDSQRRHATHYQKVSATANSLYHQGGERLIQQGLALFDLEWTNIQTGHAWAARYADKDTQALSLCDDYPGECFRILNVRQHPRERIAWLDTALIAARKLARRRAEGWHLSNLGIAYHTLGEYRRAIEYQEQHLTVAREIGDRGGEGSALGNLGAAYDALGETRRAIEYHEQHLTIAHEIDNRGHEGMALGNLGAAYHALGEYRRAIEYYEQALTIRRELGDWRDESVDLGNLGTAYAALGAARRAIEYYEQQRAIAEKIGDRSGEASSLWGLAICCYAANERPQAIAHAQAALDIFTTIESPSAQTMRDLLAQWQQAEQ